MHEFSIATQIVESVLEFAETQGASEVVTVRLQIGELMCVETEQLAFCFHSITHATPLENSKLEFEMVPALVRCSHCKYSGPPKYWDGALAGASIPTLQCPQCGQAAEASQGHECAIKSVQFVSPSVSAAG